jgi:diguanylate cyclase (GGDEF)-like protein
MTVLALAASATLTIVALVALTRVSTPADRLADRELPALRALNDTASALARSQVQLQLALSSTSAEARTGAIAQAAAVSQIQDAAWTQYLAIPGAPAAAEALKAEYLIVDQQSRALGAALIGSNPETDPNFANKQAAGQVSFDRAAAIVQELRAIYSPEALSSSRDAASGAADARQWLLIAFGATWVLTLAAGLVMLRSARADERVRNQARLESALTARRSELETRLQRGLEMAPSEEAAFGVVSQALGMVGGNAAIEVLVADSSHAHFQRVTSTAPDERMACAVAGPHDCPAASTGQTRFFSDSTNLDACPYLRQHADASWAICVPISMAGRTTGVIHAEDVLAAEPSQTMTRELELVARKTGDRIGGLRILARSESQAQLDPLTGLPNRRTLESRAYEMINEGSPFVVAFLDLDHFKELNDTHGHETGDRALRLFGRVLRTCVRPRDIPARYGGEEFVVVLPDGSLTDARAVVERIRTQLDIALASGAVPAFTISAGLAGAAPDEPLGEVIARADAMLLRAKMLGRNRIVSFGDDLDADLFQADEVPTR